MATTTASTGRFVWHELATNDSKRAVAFYSELFGWKAREQEMGPGFTYTMFKAGDMDVGGARTSDPAEPLLPHWREYCTVPDVDAAARRAAQLGGKVLVPPTDIPKVGRFAAVADPQGGILFPFRGEPSDMPEPQGPPPIGAFCWDELMTSDPVAAATFYAQIYGWSVTEQEMGAAGTYRVLKRGDVMTGGIMKLPTPQAPTSWGAYVAVADVDATMKRAESLGAKLLVPPAVIPSMGRFAVFCDPAGAVLSVFQGQ
jgi:predicted enzyme related to lactoylglutathione lyase